MAAPLGFKTFTTGEVLTAADTNGYLMQGIWTFANATARDAAVTSPQEGNTCYLKDTDVIQVYSGSAWVTKSGSSPLTTKGDLYTYSTTDARLGVGANDTVLTADSTAATGLKWATPATGSLTLLSTTTLSGASTTISSISQSYTNLVAYVYGVTNATGNGFFKIKPNNLSNCYSNVINDASSSSVYRNQEIYLTGNPSVYTSAQNAYTITFPNYASTLTRKTYEIYGGFNNASLGDYSPTMTFGYVQATTAISSLVFLNSGGDLSAGTVLLYGVK